MLNVSTAVNSNSNNMVLEARLRGLIKVESPYFALKNISISDGAVCADVPVEYFEHDELLGISLSEAGRHMAILGSLALAEENPVKEKHYYLATNAIFDRRYKDAFKAKVCFCRAQVTSMTKRLGEIEAQMYSENNELIYEAKVRYAILHHNLFARKFNSMKVFTPTSWEYNPYEQKTPLRVGAKTAEQFEAYIDKVEVKDCLGHFHDYPAFPVARLACALIDVAGKHFTFISQKEGKYLVTRTVLNADSLIFAGERVKIITKPVGNPGQAETLIEAFAYTERCGEKYAVKMELWYC